MLFQSYTSGRPVEFVHSSKGKASQDPLGEAEDVNKRECLEVTEEVYDDESDAGDGPEFDVDDLFDSDDVFDSDDDAVDEDIDKVSNGVPWDGGNSFPPVLNRSRLLKPLFLRILTSFTRYLRVFLF
jgi:hypothetical protein